MRREGRRGLIGLVLLALHAGAQALGRDLPFSAFDTQDDVRQVISCGQWSPPSPSPAMQVLPDQGFYRVVLAERYAQSFLYVQWMAVDPDARSRAVHTLSIAEFNNDHASILLEDLRCSAPQSGQHGRRAGIVLQARAWLGHEDKTRRVRIDVGPQPLSYRLRWR